MRELGNEGMVVHVGTKSYHIKVHLVGSFGDIPSVSQINHLTGHNSYCPCRLCTIRPPKVGCLGYSANLDNDPCRLRVLNDFLVGDVDHGVKKPSCFRKLCSFISPVFMGVDIFHLFNLNIAKQIRNFIERKGCITYLKPIYQRNICMMIDDQVSAMPDIFKGEFRNALSPTQSLRGVDWGIFLQFVLPTLVVEQLELQQHKKDVKKKIDQDALNDCILAFFAISKIASIAFQHTTNDFDLLQLEVLVEEWRSFLRKYMDPKDFTIISTTWNIYPLLPKSSTCRKSAVTLWREE